MRIRRIICAILSLALLLGMLGFDVPALAAGNPGYFVEGEVSGQSFVVHVYLQNTAAYSGRLALSYDTDLLELVDGGSFGSTVKQSSNAVVTAEQNAPSVLLGDGHVMFAWYSKPYSGINARSSKKKIADIEFRLVNGASESDFNRNTIGLYYVNDTMVYNWSCSAAVITTGLETYRNNAANADYLCDIDYEYPNCDYVPPSVYNASVNVTDTSGSPISAAVTVDGVREYTDMGGHTDFKLLDGVYAYRISASGYEIKTGYFIVDGKDEVFNVQLRSDSELAQYDADNIKIGYVEGDYASSVTANVTLPAACEHGSISWTSSDSGVLTNEGIISRKYDDTIVTLTARVRVGAATVTRAFDLTVKSRYSAEEKNAMMAAQDKAALEIGYAPGDSAQSVTVKLTLPEKGDNGSTISWESSNNDVIDASGVVTRPESATAVKLTAYVIRGTAVATKEFTVFVKGLARAAATPSPTAKATPTPTPKATATPTPKPTATPTPTPKPTATPTPTPTSTPRTNDNQTETPQATEKPTETETPAATEKPTETEAPQATEKPKETEASAATEKPKETEAPVVTEEPALPEYEELTDSDLVTNVINALEIGYAKDEDADNVKSDLTLPFIGAEDTSVVWTSSYPAVITPYGGVVRQAEDTTVTLTATVTHGSVSNTKTFTVTVKAADEIPVNPNNGQEEEIKVKNARKIRSVKQEQKTDSTAGTDAANDKNGKNDIENTDIKTNGNVTGGKRFEDTDVVPWAQEAINSLADRGIINGTSDTTYSPQNNIRRADFVILLVKLLNLDAEITDTFDDVTEGTYYYNEVSKAKSLGVISGIDDTHFNPDGYISRQDMMTMTYRALVKLGMAGAEADSLDKFNDADTVSDYALESVKHLVGGGYIHGDERGNLNPEANTTRAETAVFLYNLDI